MKSIYRKLHNAFICFIFPFFLLNIASPMQAQSNHISDFFAKNMSLVKGESTAIYWYSQDAAYARVFGFGKELNSLERRLNGGMTVAPQFSTSYELRVYNSSNEQVDYKLFTIIVTDSEPALELKRFNASTTLANPGQAVDINYEVTGFKELSIVDQASGQEYKHLNFCCTLTVYPKKSTVYTLKILDRNDRITQYFQSVDVKQPPTPIIESFQSSSAQIFDGETVRLSWQASGPVASVRIQNKSSGEIFSSLPDSGQINLAPNQRTLYSLQVTGDGGQVATSELWVNVLPRLQAPALEYFYPSKADIVLGETVTLAWKANGSISTVSLTNKTNGQTLSQLAANGQLTFTPTQTTLYSLQVLGSNGQVVTGDVWVRVTAPPQAPLIEAFQSSKVDIYSGEAIDLSWRVRGAISSVVVIEKSSNRVFSQLPAEGRLNLAPTQTGLYTLQVIGANGPVSTADVLIRVGTPSLAKIEYFTASRYEINPGETVNLYWKTQSALDAALVTNDIFQTANYDIPYNEGTFIVTPYQTTTYTLKVLSPNGQVIDSQVTIAVRHVSPPSVSTTTSCSASATSSSNGHGSSSSSASASCSNGRASAYASSWARW